MSTPAHLRGETRYFKSIPWCAALLDKPNVNTFVPTSRLGEASQDTLFRETLNNEGGIPHIVGFYTDPFAEIQTMQASIDQPPGPGTQFHLGSISIFFDLRAGVHGFNGTVHGGMIGCLFDEAMGSLLWQNSRLQYRHFGSNPMPSHVMDLREGKHFTAGMEVQLRKPILTPSIVVATASLDRIEGRKKMFFKMKVEDKDGVVHATATGLWMLVGKPKPLPNL